MPCSPVFNAKKPWPAKIVLPTTFRPELTNALKLKDRGAFTNRMRKQFVARLFDYFSQFSL